MRWLAAMLNALKQQVDELEHRRDAWRVDIEAAMNGDVINGYSAGGGSGFTKACE